MLKRVLLSLSIISLLTCTNISAEEISDDLAGFDEMPSVDASDDLSGFEETPSADASNDLSGFEDEVSASVSASVSQESTKESSHVKEKESVSLSGNIAFKTSLGLIKHEVDNIDYSGINQAQTSLYLQLDSKLSDDWKLRISGDMFYDAVYDMYKNNNYSQRIEDDYKTQIRLDDTYIQGRLTPNLDLKVGRQIVIWGKSDSIRVTDVINPLDNRLPGMTDIEDLRLGVGMAKLDYYTGSWNFSAMAIVENRVMIEATPRSEFFGVDNIFSSAPNPFLELKTPAVSFDNMQYAFAANGVF